MPKCFDAHMVQEGLRGTPKRGAQSGLVKFLKRAEKDVLIIAAAADAGVTALVSEDLGTLSYRRLEGVELINPFLPSET